MQKMQVRGRQSFALFLGSVMLIVFALVSNVTSNPLQPYVVLFDPYSTPINYPLKRSQSIGEDRDEDNDDSGFAKYLSVDPDFKYLMDEFLIPLQTVDSLKNGREEGWEEGRRSMLPEDTELERNNNPGGYYKTCFFNLIRC